MSESDEEGETIDHETLEARLDAAAEELDDAETEAELDRVEETLDAVETDLETAELPEPDDEDEEGAREELESRLADLRDDLEAKRGPYAADVIESIEAEQATIEEAEWTETGEAELAESVKAFLATVSTTLEADLESSGATPEELVADLGSAAPAVEGADLDPDADAETIAALIEATETLTAGVEEAETWDDLTVRQKLDAHGFYDVLGHHKDYPPEWSAIKAHEQEGNAEPILLALDLMDSNFMEEHCIDALRRLGDEKALDAMMDLAQKRNQPAIEVLGKIGSDEPVEMLLDYADTPKNPQLQQVTLKALGEIGSEEATQTVANQLAVENETVRSYAARSLGMIGDTRAISPLSDVLANDESDVVRGSAAWALVQIGTEDAREELRAYADDRSYLVQAEAEKAIEVEPAA